MQIDGFSLVRKQDGTVIEQWPQVPVRIELPNGDILFSADCGWENETMKIVAETYTVPDPPIERRKIARALLVDRLQTAGKLAAARAALDAADLYTRERWNSREAVYVDDPAVVGLLNAIGADVNAILAL